MWGKNDKNLDFNFDNIAISKLVETKSNSKYLIGCLHDVVKPLVWVLPKMSGCVKTFKDKDNNDNKLMLLKVNSKE